MTPEEKAKAYDEALAWMRELYPRLHGATKEDAEHYFPELRESEDERIRKAIIHYILYETKGNISEATEHVWVTWLEKQKEQKPVEYLDAVKVYAIMKKLHDLSFSQSIPINSEEYKQIGEITKDVRNLLDYPIEQKPAEWSEEDTEMYINVASSLRGYACGLENEEHKRHIQKGLDWLENRFKSLRPQPRQEVTDEEIEEMVIKRSRSSGTTKSEIAFYRNGIKDAIKRFGVRPSWKPSKKQMKELKDASAVMKCDSDDAAFPLLKTLYEQLQKL